MGRPVAIEAHGLWKSFRVPTDRAQTLKERVVHPLRRPGSRHLQALREVSFEVERGELFCVIGPNGSGKSTLLKLLAGIYSADRGRMRVAGRLAPFIELGVGFNPELNARENVVINGVLMGLSRAEATRRIDQILAFAELEEFAEMRLRNFSSGMSVRLAFSVMTHVDADIMLVDEVLAVGDIAFQRRCLDVFERLREAGMTIVLVSHAMQQVEQLADRALLLKDGRVEAIGEPREAISRLEELSAGEAPMPEYLLEPSAGNIGSGARIIEAWIEDVTGARVSAVDVGERLELRVRVATGHRVEAPLIGIDIHDPGGRRIAAAHVWTEDGRALAAGEEVLVRLGIEHALAPGEYVIAAGLGAYGASAPVPLAQAMPIGFGIRGANPLNSTVALEVELSVETTKLAGSPR